MTGKDLFAIWAPPEHERWTRFAKPSLFVHVNGFPQTEIKKASLPMDIFRHRNDGSAFIVDLPGTNGVECGLALAELGFVPVPLYNGINEPNIGGLTEVLNNGQIADALLAGSTALKTYKIGADALPAFLLDSNRNREAIANGMYDNRWSVEPDDLPSGFYLKSMGVNRVVVWTNGNINNDLTPIIENYRGAGIEVTAFYDNRIMPQQSALFGAAPFGTAQQGINLAAVEESPEQKALKENVRKFENGRFALLLIAVMAVVNFVSMFFSDHGEPFLWSTPSLQWIVYDLTEVITGMDIDMNHYNAAELLGDIGAIIITIVIILVYFLSQKKRGLMIAALVFYGIDTIVYTFYVLVFGFSDFMFDPQEGEILILSFVAMALPIFCMVLITKAFMAEEHLRGLTQDEYIAALDNLDGRTLNQKASTLGRHFGGFRGYSGYGGSGLGGYRGSGRSYGGFGG